jgi:hypothetical protein
MRNLPASRNPQPSKQAALGHAVLSAHVLQRIIELCATVATHSVRPAIDGESAAQIAVVTTEEEIKHPYSHLHDPSLFIEVSLSTVQFRSQIADMPTK